MKLRKAAKNAPLDLDDPLETDSDYSEDETSEYDRLTNFTEEEEDSEQEGEGGTIGEDGDGNGEDEHAGDHDSELTGPTEPAAAGVPCHSNTKDGSDTSDEEEDEDEEEEEDTPGPAGAAFNPFTLLSSDCNASGSDADGEGEAAAAQLLTPDSDDDSNSDGEGDAGVHSAGGSRAEERRRRRQRKNPRRRRRGAAPSYVDWPVAAGVAESAEAEVTAAAAQAPGQDWPGASCHAAGLDGEGCCPEGAADGVEDSGFGDDGEEATADCWLCFCEGRVARHGARGGTGCGCSCGGCGSSGTVCETASGSGNADDADSELVAPCRTCAGGMRYIHRSCFEKWLKSSWALACPNCRQLYDSAVLDGFTSGVSVPSMLLASCPPGHDLRQPFPPDAYVHFCVGGIVELSMSCGRFTPGDLLRHMRSFVDEMSRRGGDGGLGLELDGRMLQLPGFDVTGLVLDLGPSGSSDPWVDRWRGWQTLVPGDEDGDRMDERDDDWLREAVDNPTVAYNDSDAEYDSQDEAERGAGTAEAVRSNAFRSWPPPALPPAASRERSFTSAISSSFRRFTEDETRAEPFPFALIALGGYNTHLAEQAASSQQLLSQQLRVAASNEALEALMGAPPAPPAPPRDDPERRAAAMRSAADRAVLLADRQRQRGDLLLQQRNQQRYSSGSRGQQAVAGAPRGGGGGRRR